MGQFTDSQHQDELPIVSFYKWLKNGVKKQWDDWGQELETSSKQPQPKGSSSGGADYGPPVSGLPSSILGQILVPYFDGTLPESAFLNPETSAIGGTPQYTYLAMKNIWYVMKHNGDLSNQDIYERLTDGYITDSELRRSLKSQHINGERAAILRIIDAGYMQGNPLDPDGASYQSARPAFLKILDELDANFVRAMKLYQRAMLAAANIPVNKG